SVRLFGLQRKRQFSSRRRYLIRKGLQTHRSVHCPRALRRVLSVDGELLSESCVDGFARTCYSQAYANWEIDITDRIYLALPALTQRDGTTRRKLEPLCSS